MGHYDTLSAVAKIKVDKAVKFDMSLFEQKAFSKDDPKPPRAEWEKACKESWASPGGQEKIDAYLEMMSKTPGRTR